MSTDPSIHDATTRSIGSDAAASPPHNTPDAARPHVASGESIACDSPGQPPAGSSGRTLGEFRLVCKVGQGAQGSVYLAEDLSLARFVALKVSRARGKEGQVLARLNHPHIVRVYREQILGEDKLLAMQFVPGQNLLGWIRWLAAEGRESGSSEAFQRWAADVRIPEPFADARVADEPAARQVPAGDHARTAVWLIHTVALALHHAHRRGVLHHDIKPANIMIDTAGNPLLTDFNVASLSDEVRRTSVGGTVPYMAPEHLLTLQACMGESARPESARPESVRPGGDAIDVRSDVYSLAVVLYELLCGQVHWQPIRRGSSSQQVAQLLADRQLSGPPPLKAIAGVTPALAAIVDKALQPDPNRRYQDADALATDLHRWLEGRPNRYAANPSLAERALQLGRRRRRTLAVIGAAVVAVLLLSATVLWRESARLQQCQVLADQAEAQLDEGRASRAAERLGRAESLLSQVVWLPYWSEDAKRRATSRLAEVSTQIHQLELQQFRGQFGQIRLATQRSAGPTDGSGLIENALRTYGVLEHPEWQDRPPFASLDETDRRAVAENISELLLVSVLQSASRRHPSERQLETVLERFPREHRSLAIVRSLSSIRTRETAAASGAWDVEQFELPVAEEVSDPFEAYLVGVVCTLQDDYEAAYWWFDRAVSLRPPGTPPRFWAHYWTAMACQQLGLSDEALIHYGICVGLRPDFSWPAYNLSLVCLEHDQRPLAKQFLRHAIELDPRFEPAYLALAGILVQERDYDAAAAVYDQAYAFAPDSPDLLELRRRIESRRSAATGPASRPAASR
ncbi:serine/threonine-protein kinase [Roseimaritima sediminicola]|uniref:serine/threonine-protein kinase n=1 Tax=Roseimaritima sediminicola TaxID=2662066 RepID=UPI0013875AF1|nr:serine/threonine-protein kinase [Roseimaritima sediminicola]